MNIRSFVLLLSALMFSSHSSSEEVWLIASLNWEPYSGENEINQGTSIEKLRSLLKKNDITLVVDFLPWSRAKELVRVKSDYIGIFPAWPEDDFSGGLISPMIDWSEIAILGRKGNQINFNSIDELFEKYTVGVVNTYLYPKVFDDAIKKYPDHVEGARDELSLLNKLAIGRGDAAITDPKVMLYLAKQQGITNIEVIKSVMKKELVLVLRDDEDNRKRLDRLILMLKNN